MMRGDFVFLRATLTRAPPRRLAVEKADLVNLLEQTRAADAGRAVGPGPGPSPAAATAAARAAPHTPPEASSAKATAAARAPRPGDYVNGRPVTAAASPFALPAVSLRTALVGLLAVYWGHHAITRRGGGGGGSAEFSGNEWAYTPDMATRAAAGEVVLMEKHEALLGALAYHADTTGLPVVIDVYSDGCGESGPGEAPAHPRPLLRLASDAYPSPGPYRTSGVQDLAV